MLQLVRREIEIDASKPAQEAPVTLASGNERRLTLYLLALVSANLFVVSGIASFFFLATHK